MFIIESMKDKLRKVRFDLGIIKEIFKCSNKGLLVMVVLLSSYKEICYSNVKFRVISNLKVFIKIFNFFYVVYWYLVLKLVLYKIFKYLM